MGQAPPLAARSIRRQDRIENRTRHVLSDDSPNRAILSLFLIGQFLSGLMKDLAMILLHSLGNTLFLIDRTPALLGEPNGRAPCVVAAKA
jgi:hypothetical protein